MSKAVQADIEEGVERRMGELKFSVENNAVRHLGRRLYSTIPPALAELVANAYDGYAEHCHIYFDQDCYIIADDGIGMSFHQLNDQYTSIGQPKKETTPPKGMKVRPPMGKKGIGKLAAFSLGDQYTVYTKTDTDSKWTHFSLLYEDMLRAENQKVYRVSVDYLSSLPENIRKIEDTNHGFIVVIHKLRKTPSKNRHYLQRQLSRRFYLHSPDIKFDITINRDHVALTGQFLYEKTVCANYVGYSQDEIKEQFKKTYLDGYFIQYKPKGQSPIDQQTIDELVGKHHVRGWIGAMNKPRTRDNLELGAIVVYINGKIADEDFLKNSNDSQIGNQYILGEIFADYLNQGDEEPITSSRQGLDETDEQVGKLLDLAKAMRSKAISQWNGLKEEKAKNELPDVIRNNSKYETWYSKLSPEKRAFHNKLLRTFNVNRDFDGTDSNEETASLMNSFVMMTEGAETRRLGRQLQEIPPTSGDLFRLIGAYFGEIASVEKLQQAQVLSDRLSAIEKLQEIMREPKNIEKTFQDHLTDNPWLINPFWNRPAKSEHEIEITRERFLKLYEENSPEYKRQFVDIYIEVAGEDYPIIVELKKNEPTGHAKVTATQLIDQIERYRKAIIQWMGTEGKNKIGTDFSLIPAYAIISEDTGEPGQGNKLTFAKSDYKMLEAVNIKLLTYRDLVQNAYAEYRDFVQVREDNGNIPYFSVLP